MAEPQANRTIEKTDMLHSALTLVGAACLVYLSLAWLLRSLLGALVRAAGAAEWLVWLCNFAVSVTGLAGAVWFLLSVLPRSLRFRVPVQPVKRPALWLFVPVFMGVMMLLNMLTGLLRTGLQKATAYTPPPAVTLPSGPAALVLCFVTMCVVPAVLEEFLVRGLMQGLLARWGVWFSILVSGLMFTLLHGDLAQLPATFAASVMLGLCAYATRSVLPGMVLHFINNLFSFILLAVEQNLGENSTVAFYAAMIGVFVFTMLISVALIRYAKPYRGLRALPKQRHAGAHRLYRLCTTPLFVLAVLVLLVRALLQLAAGGAA